MVNGSWTGKREGVKVAPLFDFSLRGNLLSGGDLASRDTLPLGGDLTSRDTLPLEHQYCRTIEEKITPSSLILGLFGLEIETLAFDWSANLSFPSFEPSVA